VRGLSIDDYAVIVARLNREQGHGLDDFTEITETMIGGG
jgi:hypothetical protein